MNWHLKTIETSLDELSSNQTNGLTESEAIERLVKYGFNELVERGGQTVFQTLWKQLTSIFVLILIGATIFSGLLGDYKTTISILVVLILYILFGLVQEYRAEKTIDMLKQLSIPNVSVLRNGELKELAANRLVPGDILQLETGNIIPADVRLLEAVNLRIQEAILTGESDEIEKHTNELSSEELPLSERNNMAYMGSIITQGRGLALVVGTGMQTEIGKIADLIQEVKQQETPLQHNLNLLSKKLANIALFITSFIFILHFILGNHLQHMLSTLVSLGLAIVPTSLTIIVFITLSLGAKKMLGHHAQIRKLHAVETLGNVSVICSDKTGTLTENRMTVVVLDVAEHSVDLTGEIKKSGSLHATRTVGTPIQSSLSLAVIAGALCNDAKLIDTGDEHFHTIGDSTEGALVAAAAKMGYWKSSLDSSFPRASELPFDSDRKRMTTVHHLGQYDPEVLAGLDVSDKRYIAFSKGNVNSLLDVVSHVWVEGKAEALDAGWRSRIEAGNESLQKDGMRVLGVGFRLLNSIPEIIQTDLEQNITFVGLFGMIDPPRPEVKEAIETCRALGIRPVMITGDHPLTAIEIAKQLGIISAQAAVLGGDASIKALRGSEIENLSFDELKNVVDEVSVFARVAPEHKLKIVQALQAKGHIVSMTGDDLNDAPALRKADIGVAMGLTGTDVSKEASDLILLDDNFATIVSAVKEGRIISANIHKFLRFIIAGNISKVFVMLLAPFIGNALPLLPVQLIWLNLVIDGLLGFGIVVGENEVRRAQQPDLFLTKEARRTLSIGALIGTLTIGIGAWYYFTGQPQWQTMIFTSLAFMQIFHALAINSNKKSLFVILFVIVLQLAVIYVPALSNFFGVVSLSLRDLFVAGGAGLVIFAWKRIVISKDPVS